MAQMGNDVTLITTDESQELGFHAAVDENGAQKGFLNVISAGPTAWDTFGERNMFFRYTDRILSEFGQGQGVIIDHSWFGYVYFLATGGEVPPLKIKPNRALKIMHVFHGVTGWRNGAEYVCPQVPFPRFIGVSKAHAQYISNCFNVPCRHVFNGMHLPPKPTEWAKGNYLLSLNRISREKGIHNSIDVAVSTGNKIKVVGDDTKVQDPQYVWEIMNQCEATGAEYIGPVSNEEKWELIRDCKALITCPNMDTYKESFYLGAIEGFSMGKPILAVANGGLTDTVENGINGQLYPNPESMKKNLDTTLDVLCTHPDVIRTTAEKYTVEKMAEGYLELCEKVLNNEKDGYW